MLPLLARTEAFGDGLAAELEDGLEAGADEPGVGELDEGERA